MMRALRAWVLEDEDVSAFWTVRSRERSDATIVPASEDVSSTHVLLAFNVDCFRHSMCPSIVGPKRSRPAGSRASTFNAETKVRHFQKSAVVVGGETIASAKHERAATEGGAPHGSARNLALTNLGSYAKPRRTYLFSDTNALAALAYMRSYFCIPRHLTFTHNS